MPGDGASSLRRGLRALDVLAHAGGPDDPGLGVVDVARRLGVDKSQASRTLRTLAEHGLVERDPVTRAYRVGPRVFGYAALVADRRLLRAAPPVLAALVATLGERAHLSVLDGDAVLTLLSESPPHAVQAAGWAGRSVPAYCTAAGRALLADHDADAQAALLARRGVRARRAQHRHRPRRARRADRRHGGARLGQRGRGDGGRARRRRRARAPLRRAHHRRAQRLGALVPVRPRGWARPAPSWPPRPRGSPRSCRMRPPRLPSLQPEE